MGLNGQYGCVGAPELEYDTTNHMLIFKDGKGGVTNLNLNEVVAECIPGGVRITNETGDTVECVTGPNIVDISYDPSTHELAWTDSEGTVETALLESTDVTYLQADHSLTVSRPGLPPTKLMLGTVSCSYDPATHELTLIDERGIEIPCQLNVTELLYNDDTHTLEYRNSQGQIDSVELNTVSCTYDANQHQLLLTDEKGIDHICVLSRAQMSYDPDTNLLTFIDEAGLVSTFALANTALDYDPTHHRITYTDTTGGTQSFDLNVGVLEYVQAAHQIRYTDEHRQIHVLPLGETTATYNPATHSVMLTSPSGIVTALPLGSTGVAYSNTDHALTVSRPGLPPVTIPLALASLQYDGVSDALVFTNEKGAVSNLPLRQPSLSWESASRRLTLTTPDGTAHSHIIPDGKGDVVSYDEDNGTLTITHEDGSSTVVTLAGNGALAYDPISHSLQFSDSEGNTSNLQLDVGIFEYDPVQHALVYTDERGGVSRYDLGVGSLVWEEASRTLTFQAPNGTTSSVVIPDQKGDQVSFDAGAREVIVDHEDGSTTTIPLDTPAGGAPTMEYDPTTNTILFDDGVNPPKTFPLNSDSFSYDSATRTVIHTDAEGNLVSFQIPTDSANYDAATRQLTLTAVDGSTVTVPLDRACPTLVYNAGAHSLTFTCDGNDDTIALPVGVMTYDQPGSKLVYVDEKGDTHDIVIPHNSLSWDDTTGILTIAKRDGTVLTLSIPKCPTISYDPVTAEITMTCDGVDQVIDLKTTNPCTFYKPTVTEINMADALATTDVVGTVVGTISVGTPACPSEVMDVMVTGNVRVAATV